MVIALGVLAAERLNTGRLDHGDKKLPASSQSDSSRRIDEAIAMGTWRQLKDDSHESEHFAPQHATQSIRKVQKREAERFALS